MKMNDNQPIVDAMLDEWLGNRRPRPLSVIDVGHQAIDPQRAADFEQAIEAAATDVRNRSLNSPASRFKKQKSNSLAFKALAALAACFVLGVGIWSFSNRDLLTNKSPEQPSVAVNANSPSKHLDPGTSSSIVGSALEDVPSQKTDATKSIASKADRESLPLESLPFNTRETVTAKSKQSQGRADLATKLPETEVIAAIDQQMHQLWNSHDAKPAAPINGVAWIDRVSKQLLSRAATQEEKDAFSKKDSPAFRLESLHRIADSTEFSRVWAKRLAAHYLDLGPIANRDWSSEQRAFGQWIQSEIDQTHRLDSVVKNIVLAKGVGVRNAEPSPSSYWWAEAGSRANTAPAELLASKFLGARSSCSRCHDTNTIAGANQAQYWGMAAITQGVEVASPAGTSQPRVGLRSVAEPLFYERSDASMVAALPSLPDGKTLPERQGSPSQVKAIAKQNLASLSDWILQSDDLARSHTNFVWKSLFGQPLVTDYPLDESEGSKERVELANILSQQFRANDFDLRQIVVWIAASQVFSLESIRHDGNWYLTASEQELSAYQQRQRLWASFPVPQDPSFRALDKLAKWFDSTKATNDDRGGALANPVPLALPTGNPAASNAGKSGSILKAADFTESQVQYLIGTRSLPKALQVEVDRMLKSNLAWNVLVDHAYYMTGSTLPTFSEREAAQRILDMSRDKRLALIRIIAARL